MNAFLSIFWLTVEYTFIVFGVYALICVLCAIISFVVREYSENIVDFLSSKYIDILIIFITIIMSLSIACYKYYCKYNGSETYKSWFSKEKYKTSFIIKIEQTDSSTDDSIYSDYHYIKCDANVKNDSIIITKLYFPLKGKAQSHIDIKDQEDNDEDDRGKYDGSISDNDGNHWDYKVISQIKEGD